MERSEGLARVYFAIGVVAGLGMWSSVALFFLAGGTPFGFARALVANPAVTMLTIEMGAMALVSSLPMYDEASRQRVRGVWFILLLAVTVGFGVMFPVFLAWRQRHLNS